MELKFVAVKKPEIINVAAQRRQRLVRRMDQQIGLLKSAKDGLLPRTSWAWIDDKGNYLLSLKYGRQPIELKKGMFAIECESIDVALDALTKLRAMVLDGDFDEQLAKASMDIRAKFASK